jgi:hypothetical protein
MEVVGENARMPEDDDRDGGVKQDLIVGAMILFFIGILFFLLTELKGFLQ